MTQCGICETCGERPCMCESFAKSDKKQEELWAEVEAALGALPPIDVWRTVDGREIPVSKMGKAHAYNVVRFIESRGTKVTPENRYRLILERAQQAGPLTRLYARASAKFFMWRGVSRRVGYRHQMAVFKALRAHYKAGNK